MSIKLPVIDLKLVAKANAPDADWIKNILPGWDREKPFTADLLSNVGQAYLAVFGISWQPPRRFGTRELRTLCGAPSKRWPGLGNSSMLRSYAEDLVRETGLAASIWEPIVLAAYCTAIGVPLWDVTAPGGFRDKGDE